MRLIKRENVPSVFDDFYRDYAVTKTSPAVDIVEDEISYKVKADLPGVKQEEIKIEVEDGFLKLSGERKDEKKEENKNYYHCERSFGAFERSFTLPKDADSEKIDAKFENGELAITIAKTESKKPKQIEIH